MKIFNKEDNRDSKEDTQAGAENPEAQNSGSSVEKTNEARGNPEEAPASSEAEKSPETLCQEENQILKDENLRLNDKNLRLTADYDNLKKRTARQIEENRKAVLEQVLLDFLEVTDNFDRAIKSAKASEDISSIVSGIEQLSRQFYSILEKYGLEKIESEKASEFDPHKHEAIQHIETSEVPDNTIVDVYKSGYALNSKVIRPALVSVARNPDEAEK